MRNSYSVPFYPDRLPREDKERYARSMTRLEFPLAVALSLGEYPCSNNCRMCPHYGRNHRGRSIMDELTFSFIIDSLKGCPEINLEISSFGETLDHPFAIEWIGLAKKRLPRARIVVATNGISLDTERIKALLDTGVDFLQVSLNAGTRESYQWLCGSDNFNRVATNLKKLAEIRERGGYETVITTHIIEIKELRHEFEEFIQEWKDLVYSAEIRGFGNWAGLIDRHGCTPLRKTPPERYPCLGLWASLKIIPNGDVYKCFIHCVPFARGDGFLGSVFKEGVSSIWQGDAMNHYRLMHQRGRFEESPTCKNCRCWILMPNLWDRRNSFGPAMWHLA